MYSPLHSPPLSIHSLIYMWMGYEINRNVAITTQSLVSLYVVSCDRWKHTHTEAAFFLHLPLFGFQSVQMEERLKYS